MAIINGTDGNDLEIGTSGADTINGKGGIDLLRGGGGADHVNGGDGPDSLYGDSGNDSIVGGAGDDLIRGGRGNDTLRGGDGNDVVNGDKGDDLIYADLSSSGGYEYLLGGEGNDIFMFSGSIGRLLVHVDGGSGEDVVDMSGTNTYRIGNVLNVEHFILSEGPDMFFVNDLMFTTPGAEVEVYGHGGDDTLIGGLGNDLEAGDDSYPTGVRTTLFGGPGSDVIVMGNGDIAYGGPGRDIFVLKGGRIQDAAIMDFKHGEDLIGLSYHGFTDDRDDLLTMLRYANSKLPIHYSGSDGTNHGSVYIGDAYVTAGDFVFFLEDGGWWFI